MANTTNTPWLTDRGVVPDGAAEEILFRFLKDYHYVVEPDLVRQLRRVAIYVRCSTDDQGHRHSISTQIKSCVTFAQEQGITVTDLYIDNGVSANKNPITKRPASKAMLDAIKAGEIQAVISYDIDRLTRGGIHEWIPLIADLRPYEPTFLLVHPRLGGHTVSFADSDQAVIEALRAWTAHLEGSKIVERSLAAQTVRYNSGILDQKPPHFGYTLEDDRYVPHPERAPIVKTIFHLMAQGKTPDQVAKHLRQHYSNGPRWDRNHIMKLRSRRIYTGHLDPPKYLDPQKASIWQPAKNVEPLVCMDEWHAAQVYREERKTRAPSGPSNVRSEGFLLAGILHCSVCGTKLVPKRRRKTTERLGRLAGHYSCPKATGNDHGPPLDAEAMHTFILQTCMGELIKNPEIGSYYEGLVNDMEVLAPKLEEELIALATRMEEADRQTKAVSELYEKFKAVAGYDREEAARLIREIAEERVEARRAYSRKESELRFAKEGLVAGCQWLRLLQEFTTQAVGVENYLSQALLVFTLLSEVKVDLTARTVQIRVKCPDPKLASVRELMSITRHLGPETNLACQGSKRHIEGRMLFFGYENIDGSTNPAIGEPQAVIVRRIFELRASVPQPSFAEMARAIHAESGGVWNENSVRNLVRNRAYYGVSTPASRRRDGKPDGPAGITYPAIVSKDLWQAAQGVDRSRTRSRAKGNSRGTDAEPGRATESTMFTLGPGHRGHTVWHHPGALRQGGTVLCKTPHLPPPG